MFRVPNLDAVRDRYYIHKRSMIFVYMEHIVNN